MKATNHSPYVLLLTLPLLLLAGCSDNPIGPGEAVGPEFAIGTTSKASVAPDLIGDWAWTEVTLVLATPFVLDLGLFGNIEPEGPITRLLCPSSGVLTIDAQNGGSFSGSTTQTPGLCTTQGGQTGPAPFPPFLEVGDSQILGRSFSYTLFADIPNVPRIPCHYQGAIRVADGVAVELHGTGACEVPDEFGVGNGKVLDFVATRL